MDIRRNRVMGICLRRLRKRAGLTQEQLGERMHRNQSYVSKVENAERELAAVEIYPYAAALGISYHVIMDETHRCLDAEGLASNERL